MYILLAFVVIVTAKTHVQCMLLYRVPFIPSAQQVHFDIFTLPSYTFAAFLSCNPSIQSYVTTLP